MGGGGGGRERHRLTSAHVHFQGQPHYPQIPSLIWLCVCVLIECFSLKIYSDVINPVVTY